jgi:hypothetical protein
MANVQKLAAAGWDSLQWAYRNANGWHAGAANLTSANTGSSSGMARYRGARSFSFTLPTNSPLPVTGDDGLIATFLFDSTDPITFNITTSVFDAVFKAAAESMAIVTDGEWEYSPGSVNGVIRGTLMLLASRQLKSTPGSVKGFEHLELFSCEVAYLGSNREYQAAGEHTWQIVANPTTVLPDGRLVSAVHSDAPNGEMVYRIFTTEKRFSYATLVGNGTLQKIVTPNKPISVAKSKATLETTSFATDTVAGVVTTAPFGLTLTGTPGSGKAAVGRYEFDNFA